MILSLLCEVSSFNYNGKWVRSPSPDRLLPISFRGNVEERWIFTLILSTFSVYCAVCRFSKLNGCHRHRLSSQTCCQLIINHLLPDHFYRIVFGDCQSSHAGQTDRLFELLLIHNYNIVCVYIVYLSAVSIGLCSYEISKQVNILNSIRCVIFSFSLMNSYHTFAPHLPNLIFAVPSYCTFPRHSYSYFSPRPVRNYGRVFRN